MLEPLEFENALNLTKPTRLFVQDQLFPTFVPMAGKIAAENIYILGQKIEGLEPLKRWLKKLVRGRWLLYLPVPLRGIPWRVWYSQVGPLDPLKVGESRLIDFRHLPYLQAVMILHGNIIAGLYNNPRSLGPNSVSLYPLHLSTRLAQSPQLESRKIPIRLINTPICVVTGLHSCCFYPFIMPATCVIITDPRVEATLEMIRRLAFQRFGYMIYYNFILTRYQVTAAASILHMSTLKLLPPQQCEPNLYSVAEVLFRTAPENQNRQNRTVKFGSVLFSPRNSWSCSVLGSYI